MADIYDDFFTQMKTAEEILKSVLDRLDEIDDITFMSLLGCIIDFGCSHYDIDAVETMNRLCEAQKDVFAKLGKC